MPLLGVICILLVVATACGLAAPAPSPSPYPSPVVTASPPPAPPDALNTDAARAIGTAVARGEGAPAPHILGAVDALEVGAVVAYLAAHNAGQLGAALALLDERADYYDCDHARREVVVRAGKDRIAPWLRERFAGHDQLTLAWLRVGPETQGVAVRLERRASDALRGLGFATGIAPRQTGKWIVVPGADGRTSLLARVMLADSGDDCTVP